MREKGLQVLWYLQGCSVGAGRNRAAVGQVAMRTSTEELAALTGRGASTAPASPLRLGACSLSNKCTTLHPKYTSPMRDVPLHVLPDGVRWWRCRSGWRGESEWRNDVCRQNSGDEDRQIIFIIRLLPSKLRSYLVRLGRG